MTDAMSVSDLLPAARVVPVLVAAGLLLDGSVLAVAQEAGGERPPADHADVESIDTIIAAGYEAISGAAGEPREWDRFRSLLLPDARLVVTFRVEGEPSLQMLTAEEFIAVAKETFVAEGMYEEPVHTVTERFGDIAHVFVTDVSRRTPDGEPFERGINSFQLWWDGERWWVVSIMLHAEREGAPIPERYLEGSEPLTDQVRIGVPAGHGEDPVVRELLGLARPHVSQYDRSRPDLPDPVAPPGRDAALGDPVLHKSDPGAGPPGLDRRLYSGVAYLYTEERSSR